MSSLRPSVALLVALGLIGSLLVFSQAHAQEGTLVVEGQVTNATPDGGEVGGLTMVFHEESPSVHNHLETITDDENRFRFSGIVFDPTTAYGVSVWFQGALYGADLDLSSGSPGPVSLEVYDAVDTAEVLSASSASLLFAAVNESSGTISALEIVKLVNSSDRTYVPGPEPMALVRFGLPADYRGLQVETLLTGADFVQVDRGFALLASVPPGEHELMYTYEFPYSGTDAAFTRNLNYGAEHLRVLAPHDVLTLSSEQLGSPETITIGETLYQLLEARDLPRGQPISVRLGGLPRAVQSDGIGGRFESIRFEYAAPIALGLFMASVVGYALWRRSRRGEALEGDVGSSDVQGERQTVRQMIADLERSFEAGDLSAEEYRRRRAVLHATLASLARG